MNASNDNHIDLLHGVRAIAEFMSLPERTVYHAVARKHLPTFRIGQSICARRSTLMEWVEQQERAAA